jgi:hypothetical protein
MGISFIRGMVFGTVLTLYAIPAMYTYFTRHDTPPTLAEAAAEREAEILEAV